MINESPKTKILKAEINKQYEFSTDESSSFEWFMIDTWSGGEFSWTLHYRRNYGYSNLYPLVSRNQVKTFKTIMGAKRNLLKKFDR